MRSAGLSMLAIVFSFAAAAQTSPDGLWSLVPDAVAKTAVQGGKQTWVTPQIYGGFTLNSIGLNSKLLTAPNESSTPLSLSASEITLPLPDGSFARFAYVESSIMEPALQAQFPDIRTYAGMGIDDPSMSVRFDLTPAGFHAQILSPNGAVYIDPYFRDGSMYASYAKASYAKSAPLSPCLVQGGQVAARPKAAKSSVGTTLRTYRIAVACTGEYAAFHGGTTPAAQAAIVTTINRVTGIFELEFSVRLSLVSNTSIIFLNGLTDPFTNDDSATLINESQAQIDALVGDSNYDIGHTFSTGAGGLASLGVVCFSGFKGSGVTGIAAPVGDAYDVDYVAHEIGHQFGGNHPFNGQDGGCTGGNRNGPTAVEPGSGSTIMAYAGICGADDLQLHSDPYFNAVSFEEIVAYITGFGGTCPVLSATGNSIPTVNAGGSFTIPRSTPFALTASGSDANGGDVLTYCWEEQDLGAQAPLTAGDDGSIPLFRSIAPTVSPTRTFPNLSDLIANTPTDAEKLPTTNRTMAFTVTVRDNRANGGGVNNDNATITVTTSAGPFVVTAPNTAGTLSGLAAVTWNVANTNGAPVSCANVKISLSTDGGLTYPTILSASTLNDGSESVTLPNITTSTARVKVEAVGNIFFDISNADFSIVPSGGPPPAPVITTNGGANFTTGITPFKIQGTTDSSTESMNVNGSPIAYSPGSNVWSYDADLTVDSVFSFTALDSGLNESAADTITITFNAANDADGDGIADSTEGVGDPDNDLIPNYLDTDSDDSSHTDDVEGTGDIDGDTVPNYLDSDNDGDTVPDSVEIFAGTDPNDATSSLPGMSRTALLLLAVCLIGAGYASHKSQGKSRSAV
jgi:hypothetical protein